MIEAFSRLYNSWSLGCCQGPDIMNSTVDPRIQDVTQRRIQEIHPLNTIAVLPRGNDVETLERAQIDPSRDVDIPYREILNKNDSFFISYAMCLCEHMMECGSSQFLLDVIRNDPMFEDIDLGPLEEITEKLPDFGDDQVVSYWISLLKTLTASGLLEVSNPRAIYNNIWQELAQEGKGQKIDPIYTAEAFQSLVQDLQSPGFPATRTIIEVLVSKLQKKVSILESKPRQGLSHILINGDYPVIGTILHKDKCFHPAIVPFDIEILSDSAMYIKVQDPEMKYFMSYAIAMLHIYFENKAFAIRLAQDPIPSLSPSSLRILQKAVAAKSWQEFENMLRSVFPIQILAKDLKGLCEEDESSLVKLMEKTGVPVQWVEKDKNTVAMPISYGSLFVENEQSVLYIPAESQFIDSLYRENYVHNLGKVRSCNRSRSEEMTMYRQFKADPKLVISPKSLSNYRLLCRRGERFEENLRILEESEVQDILKKEYEQAIQIARVPDSEQSERHLNGLGSFQYVPQVVPGDRCISVTRLGSCSNRRNCYYHKTNLQHTAGYSVAVHSTQGEYKYIEDRSLVEEFLMPALDPNPILLAGVFDGHGGAQCADYLKLYLSSTLQKYLNVFSERTKYPDFSLDAVVCNSLNQALVELDLTYPEFSGGSTACVSVKVGDVLYTANVGDSRALLAMPRQWRQLSMDAKPHKNPYKTIIESLGGEVTKRSHDCHRIGHNIAMGSSIGDHRVIGTNPTVTFSKVDLSRFPDPILLMVSDGATDVATSQEMAQSIQGAYFDLDPKPSLEDLAISMGYSFYKNGSYDNTTLILVDLGKQR